MTYTFTDQCLSMNESSPHDLQIINRRVVGLYYIGIPVRELPKFRTKWHYFFPSKRCLFIETSIIKN